MNFPPITARVHKHIAVVSSLYSPKTILDMGGIGRLKTFIGCKVVDANILNGIDATKLPYENLSFDVTVSVATLEHINGQSKFLNEAIRVARKATIHWVLYGNWAKRTEDIKTKFGHKHPCVIPSEKTMATFFKHPKLVRTNKYALVNCAEHLVTLSTMKKNLRTQDMYAFIDKWGDRPYGYVFIGEK